MDNKILFGSMFVSLLILAFAAVAESAQPMPPNQFWGTVIVNGMPVQDGLTVSVRINDIYSKDTVTKWDDSYGGYNYIITIPYDDTNTSEKDGGVNGDIIEFYVNEIKANEEAVFESGDVTELDLTLPPIETFSGNYLCENQTITVDAKDDIDIDLEIKTNICLIDNVINISRFDDSLLGEIILQGGENFLKSVSIEMDESIIEYVIIKMYYTDAEIEGTDESDLKLYHYNKISGDWEPIPDQGVNTDDNYVWANVTHLSTYGLFGMELYCGDGTCSPEIGETCSSCPQDCGTCTSTGGYTPTGGGGLTCTPDWTCTEWSECSSAGLQTRTCTDANNCGTTANKPAETEICTPAGPLVCTAGLRVCAGDGLMECSEGNNWIKVEICEYGCSDKECNPAPATGTEGNITGPSGGMPTGLVLGVEPGILAWIMGVIIILACGIYWFRRK